MKTNFEKMKKNVQNSVLTIATTLSTIVPTLGNNNEAQIEKYETQLEKHEVSELEKDNKIILEKLITLENDLKKTAKKIINDKIPTYSFLPEREFLKNYIPEISEIEHLVNFDIAYSFANDPKNGADFNISVREQTHLKALSKEFAMVKKPKFQNENIALKILRPVDTYIITGIRNNTLIIRIAKPNTQEIVAHEYVINIPQNLSIEKRQEFIAKFAEEKVKELLK